MIHRSVALALLILASAVHAQSRAGLSGTWVTDLGSVVLEQKGADVEGTYGTSGGTISGTVQGKKVTVTWRDGRNRGPATFEVADDGMSWTGKWTHANGRGGGTWRGWKRDPKAEKGKRSDWSGLWRSSLGMLDLVQKGDKVTGTYGSRGYGTVEGTVKGRRLTFTWKRIRWSGPAWLEQTKDRQTIFGMTEGERPSKWLGQRLPKDYERKVAPKPGKVVSGLSTNNMCYYVRAPKSWRRGKSVDAVIVLHGSNWCSKGPVWVTPRSWPDVGKKFMVIGIDGESWADWSKPDDPRQNYTYVNWMGKSTYKGYPYTDRESPALVADVIKELKKLYKLDRIFLGGHSQGGYLAFIMHMHFPELLDGTFPMSCGLVMQAEPDVFEDEKLKAAQRATPLAIVHGTQDGVVGIDQGRYSWERFSEFGFPGLRFVTAPVGHGYDFLPVGEAIAWMDALSTKDAKKLVAFAKARADAGDWRDVAAALRRGKAVKAERRMRPIAKRLNDAAKKDADRFRGLIDKDKNGDWVAEFLAWRDQFEFAPAAAPAMKAFQKLRAAHAEPAKKLMNDARKAFREGRKDEGWAQYQTLVDEYYAAPGYRAVKRWLADRK